MRNYIIGRDRCLVHTESPLLEGWERCGDLSVLQTFAANTPSEIKEGLKWKGSKIPAELIKKVLGTIKQFPHMETGFFLYYNSSKREWFIKCPDQYGSGARVHFEEDGKNLPQGFSCIGTIHTHPEMMARWSGVDMNDQKGHYGLHFVLGLHDGLVKDYQISIFTIQGIYDLTWDDVVEPVDFQIAYDPDEIWVEIIKKQLLKPVEPVNKPVYTYNSCPKLQVPGSTFHPYSEYMFDDMEIPERKPPVVQDKEKQQRVFSALDDNMICQFTEALEYLMDNDMYDQVDNILSEAGISSWPEGGQESDAMVLVRDSLDIIGEFAGGYELVEEEMHDRGYLMLDMFENDAFTTIQSAIRELSTCGVDEEGIEEGMNQLGWVKATDRGNTNA